MALKVAVVMLAVVAPVFQAKVPLPVAVSVAVAPQATVWSAPALTDGKVVLPLTTTEDVAEQPFVPVTVTL